MLHRHLKYINAPTHVTHRQCCITILAVQWQHVFRYMFVYRSHDTVVYSNLFFYTFSSCGFFPDLSFHRNILASQKLTSTVSWHFYRRDNRRSKVNLNSGREIWRWLFVCTSIQSRGRFHIALLPSTLCCFAWRKASSIAAGVEEILKFNFKKRYEINLCAHP